MLMTIGQRLRRAMDKAGLSQKEVADRAGLKEDTVGDVVRDKTQPKHDTVERMVKAMETTWGDLYDEPRISLSQEDAETGYKAASLLERILANDAAQKALRAVAARRQQDAQPRRKGDVLRDAPMVRNPADEIRDLPNHQIAERFVRHGARRAFTVVTDAMIGDGILQDDVIHVRPSVDLAAADGEIIVCSLNDIRLLKRLDLRGGTARLQSANPRYSEIVVTGSDVFLMIGVVVTGGK